jgi:E3 ubiquitin-protein ligase SHPRH
MYLKNLSRMRQSDSPGIEPEQCPVCTEVIGPHMVLLFCGHSFCVECTLAMMKRYHNTIKCPTCRTRANINEISYVIDNMMNEKNEKEEIEVKGGNGRYG